MGSYNGYLQSDSRREGINWLQCPRLVQGLRFSVRCCRVRSCGENESWKGGVDKPVEAKEEEGNTFKFGVEYKINPSTTSKVKVTQERGKTPFFDVSLKTALEGKSNAVVCVKLEDDKPQFGLNYRLEA